MALSRMLGGTSAFLENYWGRNQVFRTLQYALAMGSGLTDPNTAEKLLVVSSAISNMRLLLRLFDDLPVLVYTLRSWKSYWKSNKGRNSLLELADLLNAFSGQLYYPVEHIAWAAENKLIPFPSTHFWTISVLLWGISLVITALQAAIHLLQINHKLSKLSCSQPVSPSSENSKKRVTFEDETQTLRPPGSNIQSLKRQRTLALLTMIQSLSDLVNAVQYLPTGSFLWAGKLSVFWVGLFGTISSLIGLYKILPSIFP